MIFLKNSRDLYIFRNEHYLDVYDTRVESGKFVAEGLLHKGK